MQATAIRNLLKEGIISKGRADRSIICLFSIELVFFLKDDQQNRLGTKGELLINRDLTKYLNQLRRAKIVCERCLTAKGGRSYLLFDSSTNKTNIANRKVRVNLFSFLQETKEKSFVVDFSSEYYFEFDNRSNVFSSISRNIRYRCFA